MEIFNGKVSFYMSTQKACKKEVFTEPIPMFYASHFADLDILVVDHAVHGYVQVKGQLIHVHPEGLF